MPLTLAKDRVDDLLAALAADAEVLVPVLAGGQTRFSPFVAGTRVELGGAASVLPPKDALFPQSEKMYRYGQGADGTMFVQPEVAGGACVLFGIRPCDMRSIDRLDQVFLTRGFEDEYYAARRRGVLTVCLACAAPAPTCFCESMGGSPSEAPTADVLLVGRGTGYEVRAQSDEGRAAVAGVWAPYLGEAPEAGDAPAEPHCALAVETGGMKDAFAALSADDAVWDELAAKCLACGTCTFVCPTCYCFDIDQENRCKQGVRFRCWDSCMFSEYTQMAGGHNPRADRRDRVRNRFMHKLSWFEDRYGDPLCVGCGRCIDRCPVGVDITRLVERVRDALAPKEEVAAHA